MRSKITIHREVQRTRRQWADFCAEHDLDSADYFGEQDEELGRYLFQERDGRGHAWYFTVNQFEDGRAANQSNEGNWEIDGVWDLDSGDMVYNQFRLWMGRRRKMRDLGQQIVEELIADGIPDAAHLSHWLWAAREIDGRKP